MKRSTGATGTTKTTGYVGVIGGGNVSAVTGRSSSIGVACSGTSWVAKDTSDTTGFRDIGYAAS